MTFVYNPHGKNGLSCKFLDPLKCSRGKISQGSVLDKNEVDQKLVLPRLNSNVLSRPAGVTSLLCFTAGLFVQRSVA